MCMLNVCMLQVHKCLGRVFVIIYHVYIRAATNVYVESVYIAGP